MAQHPQNSPEIHRLICLSEASRASLSDHAAALRQRFDVPARITHSFRSHPAKWLGGSLTLGLATTLLARRAPKTSRPRRGWRGTLFALALSAGRPVIKTWLVGQLKQFLVAQLRQHSLLRTLANNPGAARQP